MLSFTSQIVHLNITNPNMADPSSHKTFLTGVPNIEYLHKNKNLNNKTVKRNMPT